MARRWKQKPKGIPADRVEKRGGWYYLKPKAQTGATTTRPPKPPRRIGPPNAFIGDPGLHPGSWLKPPRLNPDQWEVQQNPDDKRYYARRVTELTGLDPGGRQQVQQYDARTESQAGHIGRVFNEGADRAVQDSAAGVQALGQFAQLAGTSVNPGDPTAEKLAGLSQASAAARNAPQAAFLTSIPSVIRSQGGTEATTFRALRGDDRNTLIADIRQSQAEAAQAEAERAYNQQRIAAQVRSDNLSLLGRLAGIDADTQQQLISSQTSLLNNTQDNETSILNTGTTQAGANARADLAAQTSTNNNIRTNTTSARNTDVRTAAQRRRDAARARARAREITPATRRAWAKIARDLSAGRQEKVPVGEEPIFGVDENGKRIQTGTKPVYGYRQVRYSYREIVEALLAAGAPGKEAIRIAQTTPQWRDLQTGAQARRFLRP